jgi:hypothetical protein
MKITITFAAVTMLAFVAAKMKMDTQFKQPLVQEADTKAPVTRVDEVVTTAAQVQDGMEKEAANKAEEEKKQQEKQAQEVAAGVKEVGIKDQILKVGTIIVEAVKENPTTTVGAVGLAGMAGTAAYLRHRHGKAYIHMQTKHN